MAAKGRDNAGRFAPGNKLAKGGDRQAAVMNTFRKAILACVTEDDVRRVTRKLITMAEEGDIGAIRTFFERCAGPAVAIDVLARLEQIEEKLAEQGITQ